MKPGERRRAYRVHPESIDEFDLAILSRQQRLVRAVIDDVAIGGARVRVNRSLAAELVRGARIDIAIASRRFRFADEIPARVVAVTPGTEDTTVHLKFENELPLAGEGGGIHAMLNRRAQPREPRVEAALQAEVASNRLHDHLLRTHDAEVRHISNAGVSLRLNASAHAALRATDELMLTLRLPERDERCRVACVVRHRYADGHHYIYSCEYDWSATNDPLGVLEDLVAYVLDRGDAVGLR